MKIDNDTVTFSPSDFDGLSDIAKRAIVNRIGSIEDFAREQGTIITRDIEANRLRLRQSIAESPEVQAMIEKLSMADDTARAEAIAEVAAKL